MADETNTVEPKYYIPNFAYPFNKIKDAKTCYEMLKDKTEGNYLFSSQGLWHGGMHFDSFFDNEIRCIADGEIVAYRINDKYLDDGEEDKELYSNGLFLVKHYFQYPKDSKLTFFSLYMHTANKEEYDFSTHVMSKNDTIRSVEKYVDSNTGKIKVLDKGTKLTLGALNTYGRYQILEINGESTTGICTVDKGSVKQIENTSKIIKKDSIPNIVNILETPIKIKAGEVLGLQGIYGKIDSKGNETTHIEVFTANDVNTFAQNAKKHYEDINTKQEEKPKPTQIKIEKSIDIYKLEEQEIVKTKDPKDTATLKEYDEDTNKYSQSEYEPLENGIEIEVDESQTLPNNRYEVDEIKGEDVSDENLTIYKNSVGIIQKVVKTNNIQTEDRIVELNKIKIIEYENKKYIYQEEDKTKVYLYSDCKEIHPIKFEWTRIIDMKSNDKVSIFENIEDLLISNNSKEVKLNSSYKELFELIDIDNNNKLEFQELEKAAGNKDIKEITSKYIVKYSSEWDSKINIAQTVIQKIEGQKEEIDNIEEFDKYYEKVEKRIEKLSFFTECKSIPDFPQSDEVYHINPIGLVGEFKTKAQLITKEMLNAICKESGENKELLAALNKYCPQYEINTLFRIAHFLSQCAHESGCFTKTLEGTRYRKGVATRFKNYRDANQSVKDDICSDAGNNSFCDGEKLFNLIHSGKGGNNSTGDGYLYRGRGYIQLTTKDNYKLYTKKHNLFNPNDKQDFLTNPNLVATNIDYAAESACLYWRYLGAKKSNTNNYADNGIKEIDIIQVSANINGWFLPTKPHGLDDRRKKLEKIAKEMGLK